MAEGGEGDSGLIVASVPEGQRKLMCIQYPGEDYRTALPASVS